MQLFSQTDVAYVVSKGHQTWILEGLDKRESSCQNSEPALTSPPLPLLEGTNRRRKSDLYQQFKLPLAK